jgi:hypothetical protein
MNNVDCYWDISYMIGGIACALFSNYLIDKPQNPTILEWIIGSICLLGAIFCLGMLAHHVAHDTY